jgi:hypothetical protein
VSVSTRGGKQRPTVASSIFSSERVGGLVDGAHGGCTGGSAVTPRRSYRGTVFVPSRNVNRSQCRGRARIPRGGRGGRGCRRGRADRMKDKKTRKKTEAKEAERKLVEQGEQGRLSCSRMQEDRAAEATRAAAAKSHLRCRVGSRRARHGLEPSPLEKWRSAEMRPWGGDCERAEAAEKSMLET